MDLQALRANRMPPEAKLLGAGGVIPLLAGAVMVSAVREPFGIPLIYPVLVYAAMILSFLGGIHWGFALAALARKGVELKAPRLLGLSVLPALAAWVAALLPPAYAAPFLAVGFAAVLLLDRKSDQLGYAPSWWMPLRFRLTMAVVTLLSLISIVEISR